MKAQISYLETSFFIGWLDDREGRKVKAESVLRYERNQGSEIYTSILTLDEVLVGVFNKYRNTPDCEQKVAETVKTIRNIANIYSISEAVSTESARLQSIWAAHRKSQEPALPRDRKFRWDSIHLATANILKSDRVYAWDNVWNDFPRNEISFIKQIISPAEPPQGSLISNLP